MPWHTHLHSHGALSCVLFICWSTLAHCECSPGFYKADAGSCTLCIAGKYKTTSGSVACTDCGAGKYSTSTGATLEAACLVCPSDTNSPSGSATLSNCSCNTGYFGPNGGPCTFSYINFARQCASGDCTVTGISELLWPEDGSYRKLSRLVDGQFIENRGAQTNTGQNDWLMIDLGQKRSVSFIRIYNRPDATWYLDNFQIRIGDSSTFANNPACVTGERQFEYVKDFSCVLTGRYVSIQQFTGYHMAVNEMEVYGFVPCNAGFTGPGGGSCAACAAGKYKTTTGSAACTDCGAGKYSTSTGATSSDVCTNCGAGKYSTSSTSTTCQDCLAGKYSAATGASTAATCQNCSAGSYAGTPGSSSCSTQCAPGKYSGAGASVCDNCVPGKYSAATGASTCQNCAAGSYAATPGSLACSLCPYLSTWPASAASVATSPPGSSDVTMCTCKPKYKKNDTDPFGCVLDLPEWLKCAANEVLIGGFCQFNTSSCPANSTYLTGYTCTRTICPAGTEPENNYCRPCNFGYFKANAGNEACTKCADVKPNSFSRQLGAVSINSCECTPGWLQTAGSCVECPPSTDSQFWGYRTYANSWGATACAVCPNYGEGNRACDCQPGSSWSSYNYKCEQCPNVAPSTFGGKYTSCHAYPGDGRSSILGSTNVYAGKVSKVCSGHGQEGWGATLCTTCPIGKWKSNWLPWPNYFCNNCPIMTSTQSTGSETPGACFCQKGFYGTGNPTFGYSGVQYIPSYFDADNRYIEGYYNFDTSMSVDFSDCQMCPVGTYKNNVVNGDITKCLSCALGKYAPTKGTQQCQNCEAGKYQNVVQSSTCINCPLYSTSPTGSTTITSCTCISNSQKVEINSLNFTCEPLSCTAGSTGSPGICSLCPIGTYKTVSGSAACDRCVAGKFSAATGASTAGTCQDCAIGKFSAEIAASVCTNCAAGSYAALTGSLECTSCPRNSSSPSGSSALTACQCNAGFSGANGGTCSACGAGSYKATVGSVACTLCGANTYSTSNASISATSCLACPGNSTSVAGSSVCQCKSGYSGPDGGPCEACSVGFYKTTAGAANCTRCPENTVSTLASTTLASCKCDAGHSGPDGGQCTACAAGSYKPTVGSVACTLCGVNTYGTTLGAISNTSCVGCPGNSTSVRGSDKPELCFCKAGYEQTKEFDSCIECRPGFYDNITNRHECSICGGGLYSASWGASGPETCKECGPGTWSDIGSATCSLCPPNSNSSARSTSLTDCKCIPGFTGQDGQTCEACERGEYKASVGNASCTICSENSYSARGTDLYSELTDRGGTRCMCLFGYTGPDSGNCTACEEGKYKNVSGSTLCYNCARNSTSPAGSSQKSACVCNAGYEETISGSEENELNCTACARGKYKATISFKYLQILLNPCSSCPANFTTISGSAASGCECDVGYSNSSTNTTSQNWCGSCKIGTYKNSTGNISWAYGRSASDGCVVDDGCCQCPQNRTTLSVATVESVECLCMRGFGGSGCKVCSAGKYKENISMGECVSCPFGSTTVDMGSSAASHCVAARGHYGNLTVGFTACANGSYAPRTGMQQCIPCPPGATSPLGAVSDVLCVCELTGWTRSLANTSDLCSCREGFARNPVTRQCELCKANYSCAGGDLPAQPCPNASVSPSGSANTTDCVCMAGYSGVDGGPCVGCGKGEWKAVNGSSQCIKCVNNTMSVERSTSVKSCLCKPGYTGEDGGPCTACELGSYKEEEGAFVCRNCTANTTTLERGSSKYLNCLCNSGFELSSSSDNQNTTICAACAVGKYKQTPGLPQVCLSCPDYKTTLRVGSMVQSECVCVPGWFSAFNSSSCQMCAENSFKASTGNEPCTLCFPHAISPAGSNTSSACQCVQGFTGPNGGACAQCMPGQYKTVIGSSQCLQCVANSISPAGSTNATECVCNAGFVGQLGGPCSACPRDTYALKNTVSATGVCMPCPAYSESEPQSSSLTSCKCLPGYEGTAGGPCTPCGLGYYRGSNDATCRQCPRYTNTTSLIAQSAAECKGTPGYVTGVVKMPSVNITTTLPYSLEQFTDDVQAKIKKSIAASAQAVCECVVNEEDVTILDVKPISEETAVSSSASSSATRRLLQASGAQLQLIHSIEVDTIDDVEEILNSMTVSILNEELKAQGLNGSTYNISKVPNIEDIVYASPCPQNTYKNSLGNNSCSSCPPQSSAPSGSSSIDACKCEGNLMKNRQGFCDRECAAGFEARTSMDVGGQMVTACAPCLKSFYKASAGSQDCTRCPPNSFSLLYNQTSVTSCMCEQGYIWNSVSNLCDACPPGTSNNNYNESVCYLCNTTCPADVL